MYEFKLPDVGEGIHEAEVLQWLVNVGEVVAPDQPILEIQTDKAIVEIPSPISGKIVEIRAQAGQMARVGEVLIVIEPSTEHKRAPKRPTNGQQTGQLLKIPALAGPGQRVLAAPFVRKLARELDIDLTQVPGSGPAGRILPDDVRNFAAKPTPPPHIAEESMPVSAPPTPAESLPLAPLPAPLQPAEEIIEEMALRGLRRRIAERMEEAWRIPHVTSFEEVDVTHLVALREHLKPEAERRGVHLTYMPFIIKATIQTLKEFPYFNATLDLEREKILLRRYYHIGFAAAVPNGLLVPVIHHADRLNLLQLAAELKRLAESAQKRKLNLAELSGSTFSITNFGSFGSLQGTPIINPPEVAILGIGRIEEKPVAVNGEIEVRPMLPLALSYDHRLIDGMAAGEFLARLKTLLTDPSLLFLE